VAAPEVAPPDADNAPVDEALAFVAATPGALVTFPLEDLLALVEQPNLPGSIDEHPNWRRRMTLPVDAMFDDPTFTDRLLAVDRARRAAAAHVAAAPSSNSSAEPDTP
jgi:4-alpha-glucanotransferase